MFTLHRLLLCTAAMLVAIYTFRAQQSCTSRKLKIKSWANPLTVLWSLCELSSLRTSQFSCWQRVEPYIKLTHSLRVQKEDGWITKGKARRSKLCWKRFTGVLITLNNWTWWIKRSAPTSSRFLLLSVCSAVMICSASFTAPFEASVWKAKAKCYIFASPMNQIGASLLLIGVSRSQSSQSPLLDSPLS